MLLIHILQVFLQHRDDVQGVKVRSDIQIPENCGILLDRNMLDNLNKSF